MKKYSILALVMGAAFVFSSCELVEGIFQAGVIGGVLLVVAIVALIIWLVRKMKS